MMRSVRNPWENERRSTDMLKRKIPDRRRVLLFFVSNALPMVSSVNRVMVNPPPVIRPI